jgi:hypothetical protein
MRSSLLVVGLIVAGMLACWACADSWAADYNSRFIRNYPPGYYGMWYKADRFDNRKRGVDDKLVETYRWDRYMTRVTGLEFPWYPIPFGWEYGTGRKFNLPNYNSNDWR